MANWNTWTKWVYPSNSANLTIAPGIWSNEWSCIHSNGERHDGEVLGADPDLDVGNFLRRPFGHWLAFGLVTKWPKLTRIFRLHLSITWVIPPVRPVCLSLITGSNTLCGDSAIRFSRAQTKYGHRTPWMMWWSWVMKLMICCLHSMTWDVASIMQQNNPTASAAICYHGSCSYCSNNLLNHSSSSTMGSSSVFFKM